MTLEKGCRVRCTGGVFRNRTGLVVEVRAGKDLVEALAVVLYDGWGPHTVGEWPGNLVVIESAASASVR